MRRKAPPRSVEAESVRMMATLWSRRRVYLTVFALIVDASFAVLVFAFFAGNREGEACAGESIKSNVSIVFGSGGVEGRSKIVLVSAGNVLER